MIVLATSIGGVTVLVGLAFLFLSFIPPRQESVLAAREIVLREELQTLRRAISDYKRVRGQYPRSLEALVQQQLIVGVPIDPITNSDRTWTFHGTTDNPAIVNIHSGSTRLGRNGTAYSTW